MKIKQTKSMFNECLVCDKDTPVVLDKFLAGFYVSNKVNFQNYFGNEHIKWYIKDNIWHLHSLSTDRLFLK